MRAIAFESELGWMAVAWRDARVAYVTFGRRSESEARQGLCLGDTSRAGEVCRQWLMESELREDEHSLVDRLRNYAEGRVDDFRDVAIEMSGTPFQRRVTKACRRIGYGQTTTYGELARLAGAPGAARAVGNVMKRNRVPLIVPCHRVLGAARSLGGYSAPDGVAMKRRLLEMEAAHSGTSASLPSHAAFRGDN